VLCACVCACVLAFVYFCLFLCSGRNGRPISCISILRASRSKEPDEDQDHFTSSETKSPRRRNVYRVTFSDVQYIRAIDKLVKLP